MISRIHLIESIKLKDELYKKKVILTILYKGDSNFLIEAYDYKTKEKLLSKIIEYNIPKGNGRKAFAKIRDLAMNIAEGKSKSYNRNTASQNVYAV